MQLILSTLIHRADGATYQYVQLQLRYRKADNTMYSRYIQDTEGFMSLWQTPLPRLLEAIDDVVPVITSLL